MVVLNSVCYLDVGSRIILLKVHAIYKTQVDSLENSLKWSQIVHVDDKNYIYVDCTADGK